MSTKIFSEAIGLISLTHVERALTYRPGRRQRLTRWAAMAACMVLIAAAGFTFAQKSITLRPGNSKDGESITPPHGDPDNGENITPGSEGSDSEGTLETTDLDIYYVTKDNKIKSRSMETACAPNDIFGKWADLNNIPDVSLVDSVYDSDGEEETPKPGSGTKEEPVTYHIGTHFTFTLTLSCEFSRYTEGRRGKLLMKSLEKTFAGYLDFDEFILVVED